MNETTYNLIIIGSGPAGLTAAVYAARANLKPLVVEGPNPGGQLMGTTYVENWPGIKQVLGPTLMMDMRNQATALGTEFLDEEITSVDFQQRPFTLVTSKKKTLKAHSVIIATGAKPKRLNCPGEAEYWGKGVTTCAVCDGAFYPDKQVVIVGGGDTAMEDASFMLNFTTKITIIHLLDKLTASYAMQERVLNNPAISIIYNSTVTEIQGNGSSITGAIITNQKTQEKKLFTTDAVFVAIGLNPNTAPFKGHITFNDYGYIVLEKNSQTSVPGVFAAGDVHDYRYRQAITSAGAGCMAALDAERYLKEFKK